MALRQLQDEVAGMADEPPAGLEQPLLQARQRPALDGERQDQPTQEIAEVTGDDGRAGGGPHWPGSGGRKGASSASRLGLP